MLDRLDQTIPLHCLSYMEQDATVLVGRAATQCYASFSPDGAALLRRLEAGEPPTEAAAWYQAAYGQQVDIKDFLDTLDGLGFIAQDGESRVEPTGSLRGQRLGRLIFSRPAWCVYVVVVAVAAVALLRSPDLRPSYRDVFFTSSLTAVYLGLLVAQAPLCLLHEGFHALAARRIGVPTRTTLGRRFLFLVIETRMDALVAVPRRARYLPIVAGVLADALAYSILVLVAQPLYGRPGVAGLAGQFCLGVAFSTLLRVVWQFYFFLQNDGYYLIATVLGTTDLHAATMWTIRRWASQLLGRSAQPSTPPNWDPVALRHARWYAPLVALGYSLLALSFAYAVIPTTTQAYRLIASALLHPDAAGAVQLADIGVFLTVSVAAPLTLYLRERRQTGPRKA